MSTNLLEVLDSAITSLADKNPNVLKYTAGFIDEGVKQTYIDDLMIIYKDLVPVLLKLTEHSESAVRDAMLESLGLIKGRLGEAVVGTFLKDMNPQKLNKVNESAAKYVKTKYDESKVAKKKKKDERKDIDEFKKEIEVAPPKPKAKPAGPPAGFLE